MGKNENKTNNFRSLEYNKISKNKNFRVHKWENFGSLETQEKQ